MIAKNCGHSYEEKLIKDWLTRDSSCPICKAVLKVDDLRPNFELKNIMGATLKVNMWYRLEISYVLKNEF